MTAAVCEEEFIRETGALPQNLNWAVKIDYATPLFDVPRALSAPSDRPATKAPQGVVERASQLVCIVALARTADVLRPGTIALFRDYVRVVVADLGVEVEANLSELSVRMSLTFVPFQNTLNV